MIEDAHQDVRVDDYKHDDGMVGRMRRREEDPHNWKQRAKEFEHMNKSLRAQVDQQRSIIEDNSISAIRKNVEVDTLKWVIKEMLKR